MTLLSYSHKVGAAGVSFLGLVDDFSFLVAFGAGEGAAAALGFSVAFALGFSVGFGVSAFGFLAGSTLGCFSAFGLGASLGLSAFCSVFGFSSFLEAVFAFPLSGFLAGTLLEASGSFSALLTGFWSLLVALVAGCCWSFVLASFFGLLSTFDSAFGWDLAGGGEVFSSPGPATKRKRLQC